MGNPMWEGQPMPINASSPPVQPHKGFRYDLAGSRFFMLKSFSNENIGRSLQHGVWATGPRNESGLAAAFDSCPQVILVFSVNGSSRFSGYAVMASRPGASQVRKEVFSGTDGRTFPGQLFDVQWIRHHEVFFRDSEHILNSYNSNKPVKVGRDGQEMSESAGVALCELIELCCSGSGNHSSGRYPSPSFGDPGFQDPIARPMIANRKRIGYHQLDHTVAPHLTQQESFPPPFSNSTHAPNFTNLPNDASKRLCVAGPAAPCFPHPSTLPHSQPHSLPVPPGPDAGNANFTSGTIQLAAPAAPAMALAKLAFIAEKLKASSAGAAKHSTSPIPPFLEAPPFAHQPFPPSFRDSSNFLERGMAPVDRDPAEHPSSSSQIMPDSSSLSEKEETHQAPSFRAALQANPALLLFPLDLTAMSYESYLELHQEAVQNITLQRVYPMVSRSKNGFSVKPRRLEDNIRSFVASDRRV